MEHKARTRHRDHNYIEIRHNTRRRRSPLNMLTPSEYENQHTTTTIAA